MPDHATFITELQAQLLKVLAADFDEPVRSCKILSQLVLLLLTVSLYVYIECSTSGGSAPGRCAVRRGAERSRAAREPRLPSVEWRAQKAPTSVQSMQRTQDIEGRAPGLHVLLRSLQRGHGTVRAAFRCLCLVAQWFITKRHVCVQYAALQQRQRQPRVQWPQVPPNLAQCVGGREGSTFPVCRSRHPDASRVKSAGQTDAASSKLSRPRRARDRGQRSSAKGR